MKTETNRTMDIRPFRAGRALGAASIALLAALPAAAENRLTIETLTVDPGAKDVQVRALARHDLDIHAFSIALTYEPRPMTLTAVSFAGTAAAGAEFAHAAIDPEAGTASIGVIVDYDAPYDGRGIAASPETDQTIAILRFTIADKAVAGVYPIDLPAALGEPPIGTVFSHRGYTTLPATVPGAIEVSNPNHIHAPDLKVGRGSAFSAVLTIDHIWPLQGLQTSLVYANELLALDEITIDGLDINTRLQPGGRPVDFFAPMLDPEVEPGLGWGAAGIQIDFCGGPNCPPSRTLPAGTGHTVARYHFRIIGDVKVGDVIPLDLADGYGTPPINNILIVDAISHTPVFHDGSVEILDLPSFVRGRIDPVDLVVNIGDAIWLLNWMFADGKPPLCIDACDVNDDANLDIADVIYLCSYLFVDGPLPPAPYPNCGVDVTPDAFGCEQAPGC
ncbi:MAG: hypothetical protein JXP34_23875 [Planctomycetes bacterium]|nr:hypothetical protein [Planctomycetota bacterium]